MEQQEQLLQYQQFEPQLNDPPFCLGKHITLGVGTYVSFNTSNGDQSYRRVIKSAYRHLLVAATLFIIMYEPKNKSQVQNHYIRNITELF